MSQDRTYYYERKNNLNLSVESNAGTCASLEGARDLRNFWAKKCKIAPEDWGVFGECVPADEIAELRRKAAAYDAIEAQIRP